MTEQFLHDAHVGTAVEQVGRERVPQRVRRDRRRDPGPLGRILQHLPGTLPGQAPAAGIEEDPRRAPAAPGQVRPAPHQVGVERADRGTTDGHQPLLAALAAQQHRARLGVDVIDVESHGLRDSRPGRVQQLQQRPVAECQRTVGFAVPACGLEQREHLVESETLGQPATGRGWFHPTGDVECGDALGCGEPVQTADRDHGPGGRNRRQRSHSRLGVAPAQGDQEVADIGLGHLGQIIDSALGQVLCVAAQVAPVGAQGVGRHAPLDRQVIEVAL